MNIIYTFPPLPLPRPNAPAADPGSLVPTPGAWIPFGGPCWHIFDFLALRNALQILLRKNIEKIRKMLDFDLPKPFPNPFKIESKSTSPKTSKFSLIFDRFLPLVAKAEP